MSSFPTTAGASRHNAGTFNVTHVAPDRRPGISDSAAAWIKGTSAFAAFGAVFGPSVYGIHQLVQHEKKVAQVTTSPAVWLGRAQQVYSDCFNFPNSNDPNAGLNACKQTQGLNTTAVCDWRTVRYWANRMNLTDCTAALATQIENQAEKNLINDQNSYYWSILGIFAGAALAGWAAYALAGACIGRRRNENQ